MTIKSEQKKQVCRHCGRPIVWWLDGWVHDSVKDFRRCPWAADPEAEHGN